MGAEALRLVDLLAALAGVSDHAYQLPTDTALRSCVMSTALARRMDLPEPEVRDVFFVSLLFHVGCVAYSHETTEQFGDDLAVNYAAIKADITNVREIVTVLVPESTKGLPPGRRLSAAARMIVSGQAFGRAHNQASCEVARAMARRIGLGSSISDGLYDIHEWWNGRGARGLSGAGIAHPARIARVATEATELLSLAAGDDVARSLRHRSGQTLDPEVVAAFVRHAPEIVEEAMSGDPRAKMLDMEPGPVAEVSRNELPAIAAAFGDMADLKTPFTNGHSRGVARLTVDAARWLSLDARTVADLRVAAHVHDLGRIGVPNKVWTKQGPLTAGEWEQVRLHSYRSERILAASAALAPMASLVGMHHERIDGSGYHRACTGADIPMAARVLAAADAFQAMSQRRPHRLARTPDEAADELLHEVAAGRLDRDATRAVLDAAGRPRAVRRGPNPAGLSDREIEVLGLVAAGCSNPEIGQRLGISRRTAEHHVQHIYAKIGVSTRAAAALFAVENDVITPS